MTTSTNIIGCDDYHSEHSTMIIDTEVFADLGTDKSGMFTFDSKGNLYSATTNGSNIYKIKPDKTKELFADLESEKAGMMAFDQQHNLYVATEGNKIYKIKPDKTKEIFANLENDKTGMLAFDKQKNLYVSTDEGHKIYKISFSIN